MRRIVESPPERGIRSDGSFAGGWWHESDEASRIVCDLCPRECHLKPGDRGFCFVRKNIGGEMLLTTYGRSTGFCIDPIEKKPLNHFLPGTSVLSFGTAGCNLGCKFCQNWDISKSRQVERLSEEASPAAVAAAAQHHACRSVAYTYNDPVVWAEYAIDAARECRAVGIKNVAVTAGYISPTARRPFYEYMDAANVDLKAFTEDFYFRLTYAHLQPVLDTLQWLKKETDVWLEITNLVIPRANDSLDEIRQMCDWILSHVGDDIPLHFSAFHPDFRMMDRPATPRETLLEAYEVARRQGVKYVYTGNVDDAAHQSTYCPSCGGLLIERNWYDLGAYHLRKNRCGHCGQPIAGVFEAAPGNWGRKRLPVNMERFASPVPLAMPVVEPTNLLVQRTVQTRKETDDMPNETIADGAASGSGAVRPVLTPQQEQLIHAAACEIIAAAILQRSESPFQTALGGAADMTVQGAFVTLKRRGQLRACCGALGRPMPLLDALREAAMRTATEDTRLPTISPTELAFLDVDVSLLYGFQAVGARGRDRRAAVEVGRHGLQIRRGSNSGLLLPSVATEYGYQAEEFLQQACRKAGLLAGAWQEDQTQLQTFEAYSIARVFDAQAVRDAAAPPPVVSADDLRALAVHCGNNMAAMSQGATPSYYLPGCADGNVHGVALTLKSAQLSEAIHFFRLSLRPGMPLQSTLYGVTEAAVAALRSGRIRLGPGDVQLTLSLIYDPAMHGTVQDPDLRGIDPASRALLVREGNKTAWAYDPLRTPEELLATVIEAVRVFSPEAAAVFSFAAQSTDSSILVGNAPRPTPGAPERPAAVAGSFYPGQPSALAKVVGEYLTAGNGNAEWWPAVLVPHAGLTYSGRIAAQVYRRVKIPETVIILGPKHTRAGSDWAVAPHERWAIPGASLAGDPSLASRLAEVIPGLELDSAAHEREHDIEVQLPFLSALAPEAKVVGITIGGGSLARCRDFAAGLAQVVRELPNQPLLVVSTDLNHYAPDAENRRLDAIALAAIERLDPEEVYNTVVDHGISMCGMLPAVIVMETLKQLGGLTTCERVAYGTSADTGGDKNRVVGYAGLLFR